MFLEIRHPDGKRNVAGGIADSCFSEITVQSVKKSSDIDRHQFYDVVEGLYLI